MFNYLSIVPMFPFFEERPPPCVKTEKVHKQKWKLHYDSSEGQSLIVIIKNYFVLHWSVESTTKVWLKYTTRDSVHIKEKDSYVC